MVGLAAILIRVMDEPIREFSAQASANDENPRFDHITQCGRAEEKILMG